MNLGAVLSLLLTLAGITLVFVGVASSHEGGIKAVVSGDVREDGKPDCRCHCMIVDDKIAVSGPDAESARVLP